MNQEYKEKNQSESDEIDLIELARYLWNRKFFVIKITSVFLCIGIFIAVLSPKEYTASTILLPQVSSAKNSGSVGALAALAGISMGAGNSTELAPVMYPKIVSSMPFQLELINEKYHCPGVDEPISLLSYYTKYLKPNTLSKIKKYTVGLPGTILSTFKGKESSVELGDESPIFISLTAQEQSVIDAVSGQISMEINDKDGYVNIQTTVGDAVLAAELTQKTQDLLQKYITKYKVAQAEGQLEFVESRLKEKEDEFIRAQNELALYRDRNQNVSSSLALTEMERLQTKYNLTFSVYSELAKQYESALLKVKENTPVFTVIEPVQLPHAPSAPNKMLIVIIWLFLGGFISVGILFARKFISSVKDDWNSYDEA